MLKPDEIRSFIDNDAVRDKKKFARIGQRYYEADHDIKQSRIFYVDAAGKLKEDETRSNIKICHPFFTELVDQEVQYMLSGDGGFVRSDDPELQDELDSYFNENEDFLAELQEVLTGAIAKGFDYMYARKNAEDKTVFTCADSLGVVEVEARFASDKQDHILYWYVERIDKDGRKIKRIQDWTSTHTMYYTQTDNGEIKKDTNEKLNPRPHIIWKEKETDKETRYSDYGLIPFFRLDNCKKQFSGLKPVKDLIDDYDLMACGLSNNIQDTNESLYVVHGFQGDNLDELMQNIKAKKHIGVDEDGGVDIKTVDIPYEARQAKLEIDKESIYHFGMGVNTAGLKDTSATVSVAVQAAYSLLDLKAKKLEIRIKQFMRKLLEVVLKEINEANNTDYRQKDIYFCFEHETPASALENAQIRLTEAQEQQTRINTLLGLATQLGNDILIEQVFDVLDLDYEEFKGKLPQPDAIDPYAPQTAQNALNAVQTTKAGGGDVTNE